MSEDMRGPCPICNREVNFRVDLVMVSSGGKFWHKPCYDVQEKLDMLTQRNEMLVDRTKDAEQAILAERERAESAAVIAERERTRMWAVERWHDEVGYCPLVNIYRGTLDETWRQVIRQAGGDDVDLLGPRHNDLVAEREAGLDD